MGTGRLDLGPLLFHKQPAIRNLRYWATGALGALAFGSIATAVGGAAGDAMMLRPQLLDHRPLAHACEQRRVSATTVDQMGPLLYLLYATPPLPSEVEAALADKD